MQNRSKTRVLKFEDLSIEVQLLLLLARPKIVEEKVKIQILSTRNLNWQKFMEIGLKTHLASLIYYNEKKVQLDVLPDQVRQAFKHHQFQLMTLNTYLYEDYKKLQLACNEKEITCIPIKGIYLAQNVYPEIYLRQISDIDVIISADEHNKLMYVLNDLSWSVKVSHYKSTFHEKYQTFHTPFNGLTAKNAIDFHYALFDKGKGIDMPMDELSKRYHADELLEIPIKTLDHADQFIYLSMHLYKHISIHDGIKLSAFSDLTFYIDKFHAEFSAKDVCERSEVYGLRKEVEIILTLLSEIWVAENHPFFTGSEFSRFSPWFNLVIQEQFDKKRIPTIDRLKHTVAIRLKENLSGWHTIPLLLFDLFPSKKYLQSNYGGSNYLFSWLNRLKK